MIYDTNYLFSICRFPVHFYTELNKNLRPHFDNPGSSILSFAVFNSTQIFVDLPSELESSLQECADYHDVKNRQLINDWLEVSIMVHFKRVSELSEKAKLLLAAPIKIVNAQYQELKLPHNVALRDKDVFDVVNNIDDAKYIHLLINTKLSLDNLNLALEQGPPVK